MIDTAYLLVDFTVYFNSSSELRGRQISELFLSEFLLYESTDDRCKLVSVVAIKVLLVRLTFVFVALSVTEVTVASSSIDLLRKASISCFLPTVLSH
jgi:hypothetical protein